MVTWLKKEVAKISGKERERFEDPARFLMAKKDLVAGIAMAVKKAISVIRYEGPKGTGDARNAEANIYITGSLGKRWH